VARLTPAGRARHPRRLGLVLLGFDREADRLAFEYPVDAQDAEARAHLWAAEDDELLDSHPVPDAELAWWAQRAGRPLDGDRLVWFVERSWWPAS